MPVRSNQTNWPWQHWWDISDGEKKKNTGLENWSNIINHRLESAINGVCFLLEAEHRRQRWGLSEQCYDPSCPQHDQTHGFRVEHAEEFTQTTVTSTQKDKITRPHLCLSRLQQSTCRCNCKAEGVCESSVWRRDAVSALPDMSWAFFKFFRHSSSAHSEGWWYKPLSDLKHE